MECEKPIHLQQRAVLAGGLHGQAIHQRNKHLGQMSSAAVVPGGSSDTGQQQLEVVTRGAGIAVLLSNGFALLSQADGSAQGSRWQCF